MIRKLLPPASLNGLYLFSLLIHRDLGADLILTQEQLLPCLVWPGIPTHPHLEVLMILCGCFVLCYLFSASQCFPAQGHC